MNAHPPSQDVPVIEMRGVTVPALRDPDRVVLEDVNWKVSTGGYWVVAGMDGSGKCDLMSMTAGLIAPVQGDYRLFGYEMPIYGEELLAQRLRLGLVFRTGQLLRHLTVRENIALPLRYHRELDAAEFEARVNAMLELTELAPFADAMPGALGRNWEKRAGLARALMLEPEVLLVDHPLGGLDMRHANWWLTFLGQLAAGKSFMKDLPITLVVTAEDLRPWRHLACHFAILEKRRFLSLGHRPHFAGHAEPLVRELLAEESPNA
jgi:ABC-type transporter Mla maintaining outer membrane lipid asymmetry ATPase subunit MlaF